MKLIVFGATGGTGQHLVKQALAQGHTVTAFVRNPAKFGVSHPGLRIVQGDVIGLGIGRASRTRSRCRPGRRSAHRRGTRDKVRSEGTRNVVSAMETTGVRRLVCQTSLGYGDSIQVLDRTPFYFRHIIVPFFLRRVFADHALQEDVIKQSSVDWIIVRPGNLTDGERTGRYRHGFAASDQAITVSVSRADVADFMLKQLSDDTYLRKTPGLSY